jgi:hypothetical protein
MILTLDGNKYQLPNKIGFGIQLKIAQVQKNAFLKQHPNAQVADINEATGKTYMEEWTLNHSSDYEVLLGTLEALLKPVNNSPSVEEGFENATAEEVQSIMGFISTILTPKESGQETSKENGEDVVQAQIVVQE